MAQYRTPNPYNAGFALPANVLVEPPGRGTVTTNQLARGTFSGAPTSWTGGFALPDYVRAEPTKRGAMHAYDARRKTIPSLVPETLGNYYALGDVGSSDPIQAYGQRAAEYILGTIKRVPVEFRWIALEALLEETEPGLYETVTKRANEYKEKGMNSKEAVAAALASSMSAGLASEMIKMGQGKAPEVRSQVGLAYYGDSSRQLALGNLWGSITGAVRKVGGAVKSGVKTAASTAKSTVSWPVRQGIKAVKKGAEYVEKGAQKAWEWGKQAVDKLGELACGVMNNPAAGVAVGAAAASQGIPPQAGMAAVEIGKGFCNQSDTPPVPQPQLMQPQSYGPPKWLLPVGLGTAGLVVVVLLARR